ncbi:hypothetical protein AVEN_198257-1 [Araneus ventricosus]|uniref:Uncharacterized protein n=1 Tax=Araneus ventricosus TaxID=182803 RepID=A0A4Y2F7X5_ARAVE|nr:hypothetical protein AVEN_198257-1 [Araneus ventricosus]
MTPEPALSSPNFHTTPAERGSAHENRFNVYQTHTEGGSSVESGFKPRTLWPQSRNLPIRPVVRKLFSFQGDPLPCVKFCRDPSGGLVTMVATPLEV